jgi:carbamoyltransferase
MGDAGVSLVLGMQSGHEASAAILKDGRLVAAISEERLSRIKNDGGRLPDRAIDQALALADAERRQVDELALQYTFFPEEYIVRETLAKELERRLSRFKKSLRGEERSQILLCNLMERLRARGKSFDRHFKKDRFLQGEGFTNAGATFFDHHEAHALPAAYFSGFDEAAVFTMDGNGDWNIHHTSSILRDGRLTRVYLSNARGASGGLFYSHITRLLGFKPMRHEGKIIGLAAHGDPTRLYDDFSRAFGLSSDGRTVTSEFVGRPSAEAERYRFLERAVQGHSREDVSAAVQAVLEDVALELVCNFLAETGLRKVALNGGVFANVKLNQRIASLPEVDSVFVFPAMSDTGNSVGAALLQHIGQAGGSLPGEPLQTVYLGPEYSPRAIEGSLRDRGLSAERLSEEELIARAADAIHRGRIVGWFQGRMEFGPRALGNRSILARPTDVSINDWLNERLDRSEFMPFAPSALEEYAQELFLGVDKARHTASFMTITFDVAPAWRERIPAVVHVDGTARPQLVSEDSNPLYHRLIHAYHALSGIPLVLNTSFNAHEEPIVCAPAEALQAFTERRIDCLGIGPFWLEHPERGG